MSWKFWKKEDDFKLPDFKDSPFGSSSLGLHDQTGLDLTEHFQPGEGAGLPNLPMPGQNAPTGMGFNAPPNPLAAFQNPAQQQSPSNFNQQFPQRNYPAQNQQYPQEEPMGSIHAATNKDLEIIAAKLDTIRAQLETLNTRLTTLEHTMKDPQQPGARRPWY